MQHLMEEARLRSWKWLLALSILLNLSWLAVAEDVDLTGTWISKYQFGPIEEVMTAEIQQVGDEILGSFTVQPTSGDGYSGIIFGTIENDKIKAHYLSGGSGSSSHMSLAFTDGRIVDRNTLKGSFYYQDSEMNAFSAPYEASRA